MIYLFKNRGDSMNKKKVSKKVKRRLTLLGPIFIGVFIVCTITIFTYVYKIQTLRKEQADLNEQLQGLQTEEKELSSEISKLKDPEYIAKYARENYYYTKDGEYVIKIEEKESTKTASEVENNRSFYILAAVLIIFVILLLFIRSLIKKRNK